MNIKYFLLGIGIASVFLLVAGGSFFLGKMSNIKTTNNSSLSSTIPAQIITPTLKPIDKVVVEILIKTSVENGDYTSLENYLTNPVSFRIENSGCCEPLTPKQAADQLIYLNSSTGTWDFDQENEIIKSLASSYPENYSNSLVGISSDFYSAGFQFNAQNKISKISMSSSYKLLLQR